MKNAIVGWMLGLALSVVAARSAHAGGEIPFEISDDPSHFFHTLYGATSLGVLADGQVNEVRGVLGDLQLNVGADGSTWAVPRSIRFNWTPVAMQLESNVKFTLLYVPGEGPGFKLSGQRVVDANFSTGFFVGGIWYWAVFNSFGGLNDFEATFFFSEETKTYKVVNGGGFAGATYWYDLLVDADTTPPVLPLLQDITVEATSPAGAVAAWTGLTATDDSGVAPTITCSHGSGGLFPLGTTTVTCTATDGSGNSTTGSFHVNVVDTTAPVFRSGEDTTHTSSSKLVPFMEDEYLEPDVYDAVDVAPTCRIVGVVATDRLNNLLPLNEVWQQTGPLSFRALNKEGHRYKVTVSCSDASGNSYTTLEGASVLSTKDFIIQYEKGKLRLPKTGDRQGVRG